MGSSHFHVSTSSHVNRECSGIQQKTQQRRQMFAEIVKARSQGTMGAWHRRVLVNPCVAQLSGIRSKRLPTEKPRPHSKRPGPIISAHGTDVASALCGLLFCFNALGAINAEAGEFLR